MSLRSIAHFDSKSRNLAASGIMTIPLDGIGESRNQRIARTILLLIGFLAAIVVGFLIAS